MLRTWRFDQVRVKRPTVKKVSQAKPPQLRAHLNEEVLSRDTGLITFVRGRLPCLWRLFECFFD